MIRLLARNWRVSIPGVLISGLAVYLAVHQVRIDQLRESLSSANYIYLLPTMLILAAGLSTRALRWRVLLDNALNFRHTFSILSITYLLNSVFPLRAGEAARVYLATRTTPPVPPMKSASTVIVERMLDLLAVLIWLAFALSLGPLPAEIRAAATLAAPITIVGFLLLVFLANQRQLAERMLNALTRRVGFLQRLNISAWVEHFLDGLSPLTNVRKLLAALLFTAVSWGLTICAGYTLMAAFYDRADWLAACLFIAALAFAVALPAVPGNLGTFELSIILVLRATGYGEPASTATAFAVILHGADLGVYVITGLIGFVHQGISLTQLSQKLQTAHQPSS